ncbi:hypothetical protein MIND_00077800 [Mycena indigotica]|uniref:RMT2 domain-containing protein n=1 Tax=Mycena indigotica TaxID=2126181 RepID=A0A8H6WKD7_9AGAR|nr:uncharacterized protein MIND_00077800 [Mycena indigotica]KAF7315624.1 hypothetical protein MIND_00077800 [Mycena indigotica]
MEVSSDDELDAMTTSGEELIQSILREESLEKIQQLITNGAPLWYQNESEGISCLHAAAYTQNVALTKLLIENGAVWNAADYLRNTAGDIALSFNNEELYNLMRDAGIRQEMLMGLLSSKTDNESVMILRANDETAATSSETFLGSPLIYKQDQLGQDVCMVDIDGEEVGVMMRWEEGIMERTLERMKAECKKTENLRVLNVGFGLGIIDTLFQTLSPSLHVIIEPHPDVLKHMRERGWYEKPGVKILQGKWQDFVNKDRLTELIPEGGFDMVYTDPFSEDYETLRGFFKQLPTLLAPRDGIFSFFNGLGATNPTIHDVATRIAELHLAELGFNVQWSDVDVRQQRDRWGNSRPYFTLPTYRLPVLVNS